MADPDDPDALHMWTDPATPRRRTSSRLRTQPSLVRSSTARLLAVLGGRTEDDTTRAVLLNDPAANRAGNYISNELRTSKYNWINILPKSLFEQFRRVANFYFLIVAAISFVPGVSPTSPITNVLPLLVVVGFGLARDIYEDVLRARGDRRTNNQPVVILKRGSGAHYVSGQANPRDQKFCSEVTGPAQQRLKALGLDPAAHRCTPTMRLAVGDLVLVTKGETFPADMVLLLSSGEGGVAYVSTANLDGESNLKRALVPGTEGGIFKSLEELRVAQGSVRAAKPIPALHVFEASVDTQGQSAALDSSNLLLRGSILRNTDYIYGLVVYTGYDTKVALNMRNPPSKLGQIEKRINIVVIFLFVILVLLIVGFSVWSGVLQSRDGPGQWYMGANESDTGRTVGVRGLGTFLVLFSTLIPISLFVTLEFVRVIQATFMEFDIKMKTKGTAMTARATNLNEMLGTIEHVLSDKTGTLTENIMRYVACTASGRIYDIRRKPDAMTDNPPAIVKLLVKAMALCHSVVPEPVARRDTLEQDGEVMEDGSAEERPLEYQGQSPDEVALVSSARDFGVELLTRSLDAVTLRRFGELEEYKVLGELAFDSDRKRMSVIVRGPDGRLRMFTKGADTVMIPLLNKRSMQGSSLEEHIDEFAVEGLRTLVFAEKVLEEDDFAQWNRRFQAARNSLENRDQLVAEVSAELEHDLSYIAATAVEDRLQDQVPETIKFLRQAGIRLWVLTGDKRETAENIGYSANLLDRKMSVIHVKCTSPEQCEQQISEALHQYTGVKEPRRMTSSTSQVNALVRRLSSAISRKSFVEEGELAVIIDGVSLAHAIEHHQEQFMELTDHCKTVICCRVTPMQKAQVVGMVRDLSQATTLAVGDGGNDVSMIQEAHVGVGIYGKEGTQAARAADYAISEFKHLRRLLTVHGRYSYVRTAGLINLSFYKNIVFTLLQAYFQPFAFVSGTTFHDQWIVSSFNVLITSLSPLFYGIFERDLDESLLDEFPSVYKSNRENALFSLTTLAEYAGAYGIWHSVCVFFGIYLGFGYFVIPYTDGKDSGFYLTALGAGMIVVFVTLFKFVLHTHWMNVFVIAALVLSLALFYILIPLFVVVTREYPLEGMLPMLFASPTFWITAALILVVCYMLDFSVLMVRNLVFPTELTRLQKLEQKRFGLFGKK